MDRWMQYLTLQKPFFICKKRFYIKSYSNICAEQVCLDLFIRTALMEKQVRWSWCFWFSNTNCYCNLCFSIWSVLPSEFLALAMFLCDNKTRIQMQEGHSKAWSTGEPDISIVIEISSLAIVYECLQWHSIILISSAIVPSDAKQHTCYLLKLGKAWNDIFNYSDFQF